MLVFSILSINKDSEKVCFFRIQVNQTHKIEVIKVGHDQLPVFQAKIILPLIYFANPALVDGMLPSSRLCVWLIIFNTINNVKNTMPIKDIFKLSDDFRRAWVLMLPISMRPISMTAIPSDNYMTP